MAKKSTTWADEIESIRDSFKAKQKQLADALQSAIHKVLHREGIFSGAAAAPVKGKKGRKAGAKKSTASKSSGKRASRKEIIAAHDAIVKHASTAKTKAELKGAKVDPKLFSSAFARAVRDGTIKLKDGKYTSTL